MCARLLLLQSHLSATAAMGKQQQACWPLATLRDGVECKHLVAVLLFLHVTSCQQINVGNHCRLTRRNNAMFAAC